MTLNRANYLSSARINQPDLKLAQALHMPAWSAHALRAPLRIVWLPSVDPYDLFVHRLGSGQSKIFPILHAAAIPENFMRWIADF
jgi:hypothetical protein